MITCSPSGKGVSQVPYIHEDIHTYMQVVRSISYYLYTYALVLVLPWQQPIGFEINKYVTPQ